MKAFSVFVVCAAATGWGVACGNTSRDDSESRADGGSHGNSDGSVAADGAAASSSDGSGGEAAGGSAATDAGGLAAADAADAPSACYVPTVAPNPNPTPEEQQRTELVRAFCDNLLQHGCQPSGGISAEAVGCSTEERLTACEYDALYEYLHSETEGCGGLFEAAIQCATTVDYSASGCNSAPWVATNYVGKPCDAENEALTSCYGREPPPTVTGSVTGSRATCRYGPDANLAGGCFVSCRTPADELDDGGSMWGDNLFYSLCDGPSGLPLTCVCYVNDRVLNDLLSPYGGQWYAGNCSEAAQRMADGQCINRLDCCFTSPDSAEKCSCTDPANLGATTCEEAAAQEGGEVVALCPYYAPYP
jgi:hypothetical protein